MWAPRHTLGDAPGIYSVRPGLDAANSKIIRVRFWPNSALFWLLHRIGPVFFFSVGGGVFGAFEGQLNLHLCVGGSRPAH